MVSSCSSVFLTCTGFCSVWRTGDSEFSEKWILVLEPESVSSSFHSCQRPGTRRLPKKETSAWSYLHHISCKKGIKRCYSWENSYNLILAPAPSPGKLPCMGCAKRVSIKDDLRLTWRKVCIYPHGLPLLLALSSLSFIHFFI